MINASTRFMGLLSMFFQAPIALVSTIFYLLQLLHDSTHGDITLWIKDEGKAAKDSSDPLLVGTSEARLTQEHTRIPYPRDSIRIPQTQNPVGMLCSMLPAAVGLKAA